MQLSTFMYIAVTCWQAERQSCQCFTQTYHNLERYCLLETLETKLSTAVYLVTHSSAGATAIVIHYQYK